MNKEIVSAPQEVHDDMRHIIQSNLGVTLVSLATVDGFHLSSSSLDNNQPAEDKLSAVASTMCAMSTSCSKEMLSGNFDITTIETSEGNILFLGTTCLGYQCVLSIASNKTIALGQIRFLAKRLALDLAKHK